MYVSNAPITEIQKFLNVLFTVAYPILATQASRLLMKPWLRRHWLFVLIVMVPNVGVDRLFRTDRLECVCLRIAISRTQLRSTRRLPGVFGQLLQGTGISHSQDDTYAVRDYILSRDAFKELEEKLGVRKLFARRKPTSSIGFRDWTGTGASRSFISTTANMSSVEYDPVSSISILTVHAFSARDAYKIKQQLLGHERALGQYAQRSQPPGHDPLRRQRGAKLPRIRPRMPLSRC